jgi:hypothetical protein
MRSFTSTRAKARKPTFFGGFVPFQTPPVFSMHLSLCRVRQAFMMVHIMEQINLFDGLKPALGFMNC